MSSIVKAGVALGLLVGVFNFILGFAAVYKNPSISWLFQVGATLIEIGVLIWGLRMTAAEGRSYGGQVTAGLMMSVIGAVIILFASWIWSGFVFTDVFEFMEVAQAEAWAEAGIPAEQIETTLAQKAVFRTPFVWALVGSVFTVIFGLLISLVAAALLPKKD